MNIEISDCDVLTNDQEGRSRFVLFSKVEMDLPFGTVLEAKIFVASAGTSFPCEVYRPRPNGFLDPPLLHMRADGKFRLSKIIAVGDIITVV